MTTKIETDNLGTDNLEIIVKYFCLPPEGQEVVNLVVLVVVVGIISFFFH